MAELTGLSGNDVITGTATNDVLNSGAGNDTIDGGAGSDRLNAGSGDDTLVYTLAQNTGANDLYTGGSGIDTVRLQLTGTEWLNATVQNEIHRYVDFLNTVRTNANTGEVSNGTASDFTFNFDLSTRLTVSMMEKLVVWVDGQNIDFHAPFITAADEAGAVTEDAATPNLTDTGTINFTDVDWSNTHTVTVTPDGGNAVGGSLVASVTNSATGDGVGVVTWSYTVSNSDTDVQRLGKDETATEKFTVKIIDSTGKEDTQVITVTITGTNDAPVITVAAGDADSAGLTEANAGLTASDTLTVTDVDVTDLVNPSVMSVSTSGDTGGLSNGQLLAMMSVAPSPVDTTTTTTGQITWTFNSGLQAFNHLDDGESLTLTYTVRATDDSGAANNSDDQTVTITINGTDDQPTLAAVTSGSVAEVDQSSSTNDSGLSGTLAGTDVDVETLTYGISGGTVLAGVATLVGDFGTLAVNTTTGAYSYTKNAAAIEALDATETDSDVFTVTVSDGDGPLVTQTYTVNVSGADDAPTLGAVTSGSVAEVDQSSSTNDSGLSGTLAGTDVDVETLTYGISGGTVLAGVATLVGDFGTLAVNTTTGAYSYTKNAAAIEALDATETDSDVFTVTVSDGDGPLVTQTYTVNVSGADDAPTLGAVTSGSVAEVDQSSSTNDSGLSGTLAGTDVDVETLTYGISGGTVLAGVATLVGDFGTLAVNTTTGAYSYTKNAAAIEALDATETDSDVFTVTVSDGDGPLVTQTYTVNVSGADDAPTLGAVTSGSVAEVDQSSSTNDSGLSGTLAGTDVDVETLTYGISGGTVLAGVATLVGDFGTLAVNTTTGAYSYTKNAAAIEALDATETDSDVFTVTVSDGDGPLVTQTYTVNVSGADDAPTLGAVTSGSVAEVDQSSSTNDSGLSGTLAGTDVDVETLTYGISGGTVLAGVATLVGDFGTLAVNTTTGAYSYTKNAAAIEALDATETDSDVFTVTVSDGDGPLVTQTYTVNVSGADDAPTLGAVTSGSVAEVDQSSSTNDSGLSGTLAGTDVDVETLTYGISGGTVLAGVATLVGDFGTLAVNTTTGAYSYTKNAAAIEALDATETDSDVFTVTVSDGDGPLVTQTYTVNVSGADDAPTLGAVTSGSVAEVDQSSSTNDSGLSGTLAGTDVDVETLTYGISGGTVLAGVATLVGDFGTLAVNTTTGAYSYTKNAAAIEALDATETDSDVFTVTVSDGDGPLVTQTYTVNVSGADDAPTLGAVTSGSVAEVDQSSSTNDSGLSGTLAGTDVDVETLTYGISGGTVLAGVATLVGDFGTLAVNTTTGAYSYTKNAAAIEALDATETDSDVFTVTVSDGDGPLVTQTYTVNVSGADDAPTLGAVTSGSVAEVDQSSSTNDSGLSGTLAGTDVDVETLTYGISGGTVLAGVATLVGDFGTLAVNTTTGAYSYTKNAAAIEALDATETDSDVFTVTVSDGDGPLVTQTYTVNVSGADDAPPSGAPTANADAVITNIAGGSPILIPGAALLANDTDPENNTLSIASATAPAAGDSVSLSAPNVTYTDNAPTDGSFKYTVSDGANTSAQATVTVDSQASNTFNGTAANEIFIGSSSNNETYNFDATAAGFGKDAIRDAGGGGEEIHILTSAPTDSTTLTALNFERIGNDLLINVNNSQIMVYDQYLSANALDSIQFTNGGTIFGYGLSTTKYMLNIDIIGTLDGTSQEDIIAGTSSLTGETINGANKNDLLFGNAGNDILNGGNGNDLLVGGAGSDTLNGNADSDVLVGGAGIDTFNFSATSDSSATLTLSDVIADFVHGTDKINLSAIDANNGGGDNAFLFGGNNAATVANSVTWSESGGDTILHMDVNGNATADMQIILRGVGLGLTATDFVL
jgi:VCBS repeat-containing protein